MKTETQEMRSRQNLAARNWLIRILIFTIAGCSLVFLVSMAGELGLFAKGKVELPGLNLEVGTGQTEQLSNSQAVDVVSDSKDPVSQSFNIAYTGQSGYCQYDPNYYSFPLTPGLWYGPSFQGYYSGTSGSGIFFTMDTYYQVQTFQDQNPGLWQTLSGDVQACADSLGAYVRYIY